MPEIIEQEKELKEQALTIVQRATLVKIVDQATYDSATSLLLDEIIPFRKRWQEYWAPVKESAWKAYKSIMNKIAEMDDPAERAERLVKAEIRVWDAEQERIRQEAQRRAQEAAEKAAEEERIRAAIVAEQAGASEEEVSQIFEAPVAVVAERVEPTYQRASGISKRDNFKAKVVDFHALVKAAAKDRSLLAYLEPNQRALDARAKADRQTLALPGCVPYNDSVVSARSR